MNIIGKQIDRYRILEQVGQGGMAVVYKAYDTRLDREVALKIIRTERIPPDEMDRLEARFEREAKAQAKFNHNNIVHIYDYGVYENKPYLVMELIEGDTLKSITGAPINYKKAAAILAPIANALTYAHNAGMIHRDVKPSNILLSDKPILTDFGIAKILETNESTLTGTGLGIGTPEYMAPEQWKGEPSFQSDIYALGVVFYELVTGQKPYTAETPAAIIIKQATDPLPRPVNLVPDLPPSVEKLIFKALTRHPQDRFKTMQDFENALNALIDLDETLNLSTIKIERKQAQINPDQQVTFDSLTIKAPSVKRKKFKTLITSFVVVIILLATYFIGRNYIDNDKTKNKTIEPSQAISAVSTNTYIPTSTTTKEPTTTKTSLPTSTLSTTNTPQPSPTLINSTYNNSDNKTYNFSNVIVQYDKNYLYSLSFNYSIDGSIDLNNLYVLASPVGCENQNEGGRPYYIWQHQGSVNYSEINFRINPDIGCEFSEVSLDVAKLDSEDNFFEIIYTETFPIDDSFTIEPSDGPEPTPTTSTANDSQVINEGNNFSNFSFEVLSQSSIAISFDFILDQSYILNDIYLGAGINKCRSDVNGYLYTPLKYSGTLTGQFALQIFIDVEGICEFETISIKIWEKGDGNSITEIYSQEVEYIGKLEK